MNPAHRDGWPPSLPAAGNAHPSEQTQTAAPRPTGGFGPFPQSGHNLPGLAGLSQSSPPRQALPLSGIGQPTPQQQQTPADRERDVQAAREREIHIKEEDAIRRDHHREQLPPHQAQPARPLHLHQPVAVGPRTVHGPNGLLGGAMAGPPAHAMLGAPTGPGNVFAGGQAQANGPAPHVLPVQPAGLLVPFAPGGAAPAAGVGQGQQPILNVSPYFYHAAEAARQAGWPPPHFLQPVWQPVFFPGLQPAPEALSQPWLAQPWHVAHFGPGGMVQQAHPQQLVFLGHLNQQAQYAAQLQAQYAAQQEAQLAEQQRARNAAQQRLVAERRNQLAAQRRTRIAAQRQAELAAEHQARLALQHRARLAAQYQAQLDVQQQAQHAGQRSAEHALRILAELAVQRQAQELCAQRRPTQDSNVSPKGTRSSPPIASQSWPIGPHLERSSSGDDDPLEEV
ncbi:Transcriptional regulatory protein sin3 [Elasticomyces elasticus]|nr:Transcriptional regulatory protein sin3 [Elasticomyces elasticus]KAK4993338.1 Transcriptional regulatory protein sin3 [Elasticomyces elasticus]